MDVLITFVCIGHWVWEGVCFVGVGCVWECGWVGE